MFTVRKRKPIDYITYGVIILAGILIDQVTKLLAVAFLAPDKSVTVIKYIVSLTYVENRGMAFGLMADARWVFMVVSTVMIGALAAYLFLGMSENKLYSASIAMVVSGGIGNMIDRIALGYVVDFIDFSQRGFPFVFNGADSFVCVGAGMLILALVLDIINEAKAQKK